VINLIPKQLFLCLFFLFFCLRGFSAVFVVTSNADSGPGTLRDALTQAAANGTTEKDYINFNLTGTTEADKTITLQTQLPNVTGNIVVDGTTQPSPALGVSNAKVILQPITSSSIFNPFVLINVDGFEIYGMYIRDFIGVQPFNLSAAFYVRVSKNIQIGSPGKGNVISNCGYAFSGRAYYSGIYASGYCVDNLTISSNFFGFEPDGKTLRGNVLGYVGGIDFSDCEGNIIIGGDNVSQRNIFGNGAMYVEQIGQSTYPSTILIKNNYFSYDVNGNPTRTVNLNASDIYGICITNFDPATSIIYPYSVNILDNKIQYPLQVIVTEVSGKINFQNNQLLYEPTTYNTGLGYSSYESGISLWGDAGVNVGGEQPGEANIIYGSPLRINSSTSILLHRNSIYCANISGNGQLYNTNIYPDTRLPIININIVTANGISGTASPLSEVELFEDDDCVWCEPLAYFATVNADANGKWSYTGPIKKGIIASATLNGFTSLFTTAGVLNSAKVTHSACGNNGSITGINISNSGGYQIVDAQGTLVSNNADVYNLAPGTYTIATDNITCSNKFTFQIFNATPKIIDDDVRIVQPSCGGKNGSVTYLEFGNDYSEVIQSDYSAYTYKWLDANNNIRSTNPDLGGVEAGTYRLEVAYHNQCTDTYTVTLVNTTGPNIDQSNQIIQSSNCGQSTGSITNITATGTGTLKYVWMNAQQQQVGSSVDLTNQPAGIYKLQVTDDTQCGPVYSADVIIPETNGITMDESKVLVTNALCGGTGSVTGIQVTGASSYKWTDANNHTLITTTPDVGALAPGSYTLTATNSYGCSKSSAVYIISQPVSFPYPVYAATYTKACNLLANGGVSVATDGSVKSARWVDAQGTTVGTGSSLSNVLAGTYQLYLTDNNGCEKLYNSYTIDEYPEFTVANYATITADECGLNNGSIGATTIAGGIPPYTYSWSDANNKSLGASNILTNLAAGTYILHVTDNGCGSVDITYTVTEQSYIPPAPAVSNVQLCSSGNSLLSVNNPSANTIYRLYATESSTEPLDEQKGGRFTINIPGNTSYYISEIDGTCESSRAEIDVTVGVSSTDVANAFTPNGDGINDYWQIKNINNYTNATIQVFNRYGQLLFESKGYAKPFDGTYRGQKLPAGVYYYIINLNAKCNLLSGSLTLIR
jgi:gliding motility-associated-like protein